MNGTSSFRLFFQNFSIKDIHLVFLLFATGLFLRLYNLEVTGLWMDEIHSAVGTDPDKTIREVIEYCKQDQPPVFFLMLHGWYKTFGYNDFSGRLLVAITGTLGIVAMYFLGREFKNVRVGLVAAFLTMINYFHVDHSRQVRFYPLVFLLSALSYLFYLRILKKRQLKDFIVYVVATSALLNTHYFGLVVFASQFILFAFIIVWKKIMDIKFIAYSFLSGIAVGLSFLHWLPTVISDLGIDKFHAQHVKWYFPIEFYWIYFRDIVTCVLCGMLTVLAIRAMYLRSKLKKTLIEDVILLGWIVLGFVIPLVYSDTYCRSSC